MLSLQRLRGIAGIRVLLSAGDEPKHGRDVYGLMDRAADYLRRIHDAVRRESGAGYPDLMGLTRKTAAALDLPPQAVNPLLARTFSANLRVRDRKSL